MDLKTFAVQRKISFDNDLLKYVVNDQPVPISVLENAFGDFFESMRDKKAEALITDYPKMLQENVPLVIRTIPETGGYEISGDIPDTVVDAVSLVHNVSADDIIEALVKYNMETVQGQSLDVVGSSKGDVSDRSRLETKNVAEAVTSAVMKTLSEESDQTYVPEEIGDSYEMGDLNIDFDDIANSMPVEEPAKEVVETPAVKEISKPVIEDTIEEQVVEDIIEEPVEEIEEPVEDSMSEQDLEDEQDRQFMESMTRIYTKFCKDLKNFQLDARLGLDV